MAGLVTNSEIGRNGRFANQVFQYMFPECHAARHGLSFANPPWIGDDVFAIQPGVRVMPQVSRRLIEDTANRSSCPIFTASHPLADTDVSGYFQYHTDFYAPFRTLIRDRFAFRGVWADTAQRMRAWFDAQGKPVVCVHIRRGDYGYEYFFRAPVAWYVAWLTRLMQEAGDLAVYVATDEPGTVLREFEGLPVLSYRDIPFDTPRPADLVDFVALVCADRVAISNSSFSFAATMLNERSRGFMRPSLTRMALEAYDPWSAEVLYRWPLAEDFGGVFVRPPRPGVAARLLSWIRGA